MDTAILILLITAVILLIAITVKLFFGKKEGNNITDEKIDSLTKITLDGFSSARQLSSSENESTRSFISSSNEALRSRIDIITEKIMDGSLSTVRALSDMREKLDEASKGQTVAVATAIEKMQASNEKKLEEMRATVDEKLTSTLTTRLDSSFKSVSEQLSNVYKSLGEMKELGAGVSSLNRIFTNVKIRGNWAETQLEGILDQIIPGMYIKNYRPDENRDVVEFAVIIPDSDTDKKTYLPIDSKFPMEDFLRLCDAADAGDAEAVRVAKKALEARVMQEGKTVSKYINPPYTTPFAILYLATDSLYAEIVSSKENIADRLHDDFGVLLAGPSTITALLSSLAMGFRTVALNQKANEVMDLLSTAKVQYDKFGISLERAKKKIEEASSSIDDAQKRNSIIVKKLKGVETVSAETADNLLDAYE